MAEAETKSIDKASIRMLDKAASDGANTAFERPATMRPSYRGGW